MSTARTTAPATVPSTGRPATVSVVIAVLDGGEAFRRCLGAIGAMDPAPDEVIVVADGARPEDVRTAEDAAATVHPLRPRSGPAAARNLGARHASGELLLFVDADVAPHPDVIAHARDELRRHDAAAVIGSYDADPPEPNFVSQYKNLRNHFVHHHAHREGVTFWGALGAIRRHVFLALGGFDAVRYPVPAIEDIELGYRLRAAGHRIRVRPEMRATHLKRWDARTLIEVDVTRRALPWSRLILETGGFEDDLDIDTTSRIQTAASIASLVTLLLAPARPTPALAAAGALAGLTVGLDRPILRFFAQQRGPRFAAGAAAWQWLAYVYGGAAFGYAALERLLADRPDRPDVPGSDGTYR